MFPIEWAPTGDLYARPANPMTTGLAPSAYGIMPAVNQHPAALRTAPRISAPVIPQSIPAQIIYRGYNGATGLNYGGRLKAPAPRTAQGGC